MVFSALFNNISVRSWQSVFICGGNRSTWRKPPTCRKSLTNLITYCIEYTCPWTMIELTTLVLIGTDCIGRCKSNYHTITTTTAPCSNLILVYIYIDISFEYKILCNLYTVCYIWEQRRIIPRGKSWDQLDWFIFATSLCLFQAIACISNNIMSVLVLF